MTVACRGLKWIKRRVEKNRNELMGILFRQYQAFVLSDHETELLQAPAFVFHDVTAESLEPILMFLAENGYATLTADEYVERRVQGERGREREVLLTFDDGRKSLYTVAYPMLKRFGLKAVAYIVPGRVPRGNACPGQDPPERRLCTWDEIREMHDSGVIDFQSHSMYHHSIAVSDRVLDFVRPGINCSFLHLDLAPRQGEHEETGGSVPAYGTPIHDWWSRFGDYPAYRESRSVVEACVEYVKRHGGESYFRRFGWRRRLRAVLAKARRKEPGPGFESETEQRYAILKDLQDSKRVIEDRLPGKTVRHFCFPWFRGSVLAVRLSAEAGYLSNAWESVLPKFVRGQETPIPVPRLLPSYVWRLPGSGRKSLREVLAERLSQMCVGHLGAIGESANT